MDKYPKFYKTYGQLQNGKMGPMKVSNGLIEVQNEEQEKQLMGLQSFKDGGIILVGKQQTVEVLPNGTFKKVAVPNRFADAFTEEELININLIPSDVFEETVLFNIRQIAKDYAEQETNLVPAANETGTADQERNENSANEPNAAVPPAAKPLSAFKNKTDLQYTLEELGVLYPKKAKMEELYELYTKNFIGK